uniref:Uncharacterized protein n=1 Tax=Conchiformibius kuhniae TaxID=211502 RepID=A0A8T9MW76_9NEIS|nr:hypothetical protein LVJ77_04190 [Conchiformibius kuhniae]
MPISPNNIAYLSKNNVFHIPDPAQRYTQADGSVVVLTRYSYGAEMEMQIPHEQLQNFLAALSQYTTVLSSQVQTENRISDLRLQALYEQYQQHRQNASAQPAGHVAPAQSAPDTAASSEAAASAAASAPAPSAPVPVKKAIGRIKTSLSCSNACIGKNKPNRQPSA